MASSIGIKIANGEFYPLVEENSLIKKKLILTTVHDNQPSVQIDLFRSPIDDMTDSQYIGTVVVENIKPKPKGEASIELVVSSDDNGNIIADAIDIDSGSNGEHYVLTVSLKSMDDSTRDIDIPDFELDSEEPPSGLYQHAERILHEKKSIPKPLIFILTGILLLLLLLAGWLFFLGGLDVVRSLFAGFASVQTTQIVPEPPRENSPAEAALSVPVIEPVRQPEPAIQPTPEPVIEPARQPEPVIQPAPEPVIEPARQPEPAIQPAPVLAIEPVRQPEPVIQPVPVPVIEPVQQTIAPAPAIQVPVIASGNVEIPREGINYVIKSGDTLRKISEAFYRDPELFQRIAQYNRISNPSRIISGRTIRIPPRETSRN